MRGCGQEIIQVCKCYYWTTDSLLVILEHLRHTRTLAQAIFSFIVHKMGGRLGQALVALLASCIGTHDRCNAL